MDSKEIFKELLAQFHDTLIHRQDYDCHEMELWVMHHAHEMCRSGKITFEMFGKVMDEAICW